MDDKESWKMVKRNNNKVRSKGKSVTKKKEKLIEKAVEFTFLAPDAKEVFLAGEFNGWDNRSLPMKKEKVGVWKTKVTLPPGRHEYKFFADNAWVESLPGMEQVSNPLGTKNFIVWVK
jgi:1,4-alpha-glucan branching enzyme